MDKLDAYLEELKAILAPLGQDQAAEICREIKAHIEDTVEQGKANLEQVLASLGTARELGEGYLRELGKEFRSGSTGSGTAGQSGTQEGEPNQDPSQTFRRMINQSVAQAMTTLEELKKNGVFDSLEDLGKLGASAGMDDFGERMGRWGEEFGRKMENFGEKLGESLETLGEELAKHPGPWPHGNFSHNFTDGQDCTNLTMEWDGHPDLKISAWGGSVTVRPSNSGDIRLKAQIKIKGLPMGTFSIEPEVQDGQAFLNLQKLQGPGVEIHRIDFQIPAQVSSLALEIAGGNAATVMLDLDRLTLETRGGNIEVTNCRGDLVLKACGGNINCTQPQGNLSMEADAGNLEINQASGLTGARLNAVAGNIRIQGLADPDSPLELHLNTLAGHITVQGEPQGNSWTGILGELEPGDLIGQVQAQTTAGNILVD